MMRRLAPALITALLLTACSGKDGSGCTPNDTQTCHCPGGGTGER